MAPSARLQIVSDHQLIAGLRATLLARGHVAADADDLFTARPQADGSPPPGCTRRGPNRRTA